MLISDPDTKPKIIVFPKKKGKFAHVRQYAVLYVALLLAAILTIWVAQQSINTYWQQKYQQASPLESLNRFAAWRAGADVQNYFVARYQNLSNQFNEQDKNWQAKFEPKPAETQPKTPAQPVQAALKPETVLAASAASSPETKQPETVNLNDGFPLKSGDKVLFAGDSIMQGFAPYVQKELSQYQIQSINLAKQSTGLAYPKFFDWPTTVEQTFAQHKDLKLVVILIGANDPRDILEPPLTFKTPEWEREYLARVNRIVQAAKQANAGVMWLGIPHMKRPVLNEQMIYLDDLLSKELSGTKDHVLWLKTSDLLSDGKPNYQDSILIDGKLTKIRAPDGVHFTPRGAQFVADYIVSYLQLPQADSGSLNNE